jgi:hypothetical protein
LSPTAFSSPHVAARQPGSDMQAHSYVHARSRFPARSPARGVRPARGRAPCSVSRFRRAEDPDTRGKTVCVRRGARLPTLTRAPTACRHRAQGG